jgi:sugar lactone lactonase YvrE
VLDGLMFPEGPRWRDGRLYLSDIQAGEAIAVDEAGGAERVATDLPGGGPSGLAAPSAETAAARPGRAMRSRSRPRAQRLPKQALVCC